MEVQLVLLIRIPSQMFSRHLTFPRHLHQIQPQHQQRQLQDHGFRQLLHLHKPIRLLHRSIKVNIAIVMTIDPAITNTYSIGKLVPTG